MMMSEAEYMVTITRYAIRATLNDTNLNTFITLTIKKIDKISEKIQFSPDSHHPIVTAILMSTPNTSIILIGNFLM
jgi:hypothetical protein